MEEPLPVNVVLRLYQSKSQRHQAVICITCYCNQQSTLILPGQECAIDGDDRSAMFKCPHALLKCPKCTAKYSNYPSVAHHCFLTIRLDHMNHAQISGGHRSQQPW